MSLAPTAKSVLLAYDRLLLTSGSKLSRPPVPGLAEHAFSVDRIEDAIALDDHFAALAKLPDSPARSTVAVVGCGFTGIEAPLNCPSDCASGLARTRRAVLS